jgi:uncharacterized protein YkwD
MSVLALVVLFFTFVFSSFGVAQTANIDDAAEAKIAAEINELRKKEGLKPLKVDARLRKVGRDHSFLLAKHKELKDQFPEEASLKDRVTSTGMKKIDSGAENSGQNINLDAANKMFLDSPTHRANLLNPKFNAVGVGIVKDAETHWITQVLVETRGDVEEVK